MDNRMESPSRRPDAAMPAVTDDTAADGSVPPVPGAEAEVTDSDGVGPLTYSDDGSYSYSENGQYGYGPGGPEMPENPPAAGYAAMTGGPPSDAPVPHQYAAPPPPYAAPPPYAPQAPQPTLQVPAAVPGGAAATAHRVQAPPRDRASAPRRASLVVARLEPWSVMKFSFLMSLVAWIVLFVAVAVLYSFLSHLGVFASLQKTLQSVTSSQGSSGVKLSSYISESKVLGYTMLFGAINIVIITALSTIGAVIYNLVSRIGGGIEVTLRESD